MSEIVLISLVVFGTFGAWGVVRRRRRASLGGQALLQATEAGDIAEMQALLAQDADVNARNAQGWTPLHIAAAGGDQEVVALLLQHGAAVNAQSNIGTTPLDDATTRGGRQAVITLLLAHGAQMNSSWDTSI